MTKRNIIIISMDEVRPDHLSCYGYQKINTPAIDQIAKEGVRFETCITCSEFTPVAMSSALTGKYPNKHGFRNPYCYLIEPSIASILKKNGYKTAGFVADGLLSRRNGFAEGFDFWNEATDEKSTWIEIQYPGTEREVMHFEGNYWVEEFFKFLKENYQENFFIWGHFYETHEGSENSLIKKGLIKEGKLSKFGYYDAKIKMVDEKLINRLIVTLKELDVYKDTTLVVMSDHGTDLGAHPVKDIPWRKKGTKYPQHTTMYDHDLKVAMIIKGKDLPQGKVIKNMVRSIDLVPTLLDLTGLSSKEYDFDGLSMLPVINKNETRGEVYSEDFFAEARGKGALQSLRTKDFKFIRNLTLGEEEYYDLNNDPQEQNNLIQKIDKEKLITLRKKMNVFFITKFTSGKEFSQKEKEIVNQKLRALGYIE